MKFDLLFDSAKIAVGWIFNFFQKTGFNCSDSSEWLGFQLDVWPHHFKTQVCYRLWLLWHTHFAIWLFSFKWWREKLRKCRVQFILCTVIPKMFMKSTHCAKTLGRTKQCAKNNTKNQQACNDKQDKALYFQLVGSWKGSARNNINRFERRSRNAQK